MKKKRLLLVVVVLIALFLFSEFVSYLTLSWRLREAYTYQVAAQKRERTLGKASANESGQSRPNFMKNHRIHPYLGSLPLSYHNADFDSVRKQLKREEGRVIVVVMGGSLAAHFGNHTKKQLRADISLQYPEHEVSIVTLAQGGWKQPQQLMLLNYLLSLGLEFDILINIDGFNEVALHAAENAKKGVFPAYPRNWWVWTGEAQGPAKAWLAELSICRSQQLSALEVFSDSPLSYSCTANLCLDAYLGIKSRRRAELLHKLGEYRNPTASIGPNFSPEDDSVYPLLVDVWKNSSIQMGKICKANNIAYFHFLQPNQYVEGSKPLSEEEKEHAYRADHPYREGVVKGYPLLIKTGEELAELGVSFTDLTQVFQDREESLYNDSCCHLKVKGSLLLEKHVFARIKKEWAPPKSD